MATPLVENNPVGLFLIAFYGLALLPSRRYVLLPAPERSPGLSEKPHGPSSRFLPLSSPGITLAFENENEPDSHIHGLWDFCFLKAPMGILRGWHGFTARGISAHYNTSGSILTAFFVGFSVLVLMAGYAAVVTKSLIVSSNSEIKSLEEGISRGFSFCANSEMLPALVAYNKQLEPLLVSSSNFDALAKMDTGGCDAAIVQHDFWFAPGVIHKSKHI